MTVTTDTATAAAMAQDATRRFRAELARDMVNPFVATGNLRQKRTRIDAVVWVAK
jgi:hypothetical protein